MGFENSDSDTGRLISMFWNKLAFELRAAVTVWDVETRLEILLAFCHGFSHFGILAQCVLQFPMILQVLPVHVYRYR